MIRNIVISVVAVLIALFAVSAPLTEENNITKAENFIKAERWSQAVEVLENEISENSDNAKAYFMLGTIYFSQKNYSRADKEFASAIAFKSSYRSDVGKKYQAAGLDSLNKGNVLEALELFTRVIKHQPGLSKNIANVCFQAGKKYFSIFRDDFTDKLFSLAKSDTSLVKQIKVEETKYGEKILEIAKKELSGEKRQIAIKYLGRERVDAEFPPKNWVTVFEKTFIGEGFGKGDDGSMVIAYVSKDLLFEDRITITGEEFEEWARGAWNKHYGELKVINKYSGSTGTYDLKAPKDVVFKVKIERFMYPSEK